MYRYYQFSLRTLLVVMTVVAGLTGRITYLRRMADHHQKEVNRLQQHREFLHSVSFDVPVKEWLRLDDMEAHHAGLARDYERASWRPWMFVPSSSALSPSPPKP